jgi:hypothetical protein
MFLQPAGTDRFDLELTPDEAAVIAQLCRDLRGRLLGEPSVDDPGSAGDPELRRLAPPAHPHDAGHELAYRQMVGDDLRTSRIADLDVVIGTVEARELSRPQLEAWLRAFNALRLVLGTALDVGEDRSVDDLDPDDPSFVDHLLYDDLSAVVALVLHVLGAP